MTTALSGARIFDGARLIDGHAVIMEEAIVRAVVAERDVPSSAERRQVDGLIAPGFIDIQVNGGGGILFNDSPTVEGIAAIGAAHRRFGTTGFLPTFISDTRARMGEGIAAVRGAIAAKVPGVLGIHLEGPFIHGPRRGVHDARYVRSMEAEDVALITKGGAGRTLVTLAPDEVPPEKIAELTTAGVIVSAGHTAASLQTMMAARRAGLTGFTHLFNAMPPLSGREPGPVGAALDDANAWASLIVDLHHVSAEALRVAIAAKGWQRLMLVTDAMPTVGTDATGFDLFGKRISLAGGKLTTAEGALAGAHLDIATAVRNTVDVLGLPVEAALHMASRAPAEFLGLDRFGRIGPGYAASLVLLDDALAVTETWIDGVSSNE